MATAATLFPVLKTHHPWCFRRTGVRKTNSTTPGERGGGGVAFSLRDTNKIRGGLGTGGGHYSQVQVCMVFPLPGNGVVRFTFRMRRGREEEAERDGDEFTGRETGERGDPRLPPPFPPPYFLIHQATPPRSLIQSRSPSASLFSPPPPSSLPSFGDPATATSRPVKFRVTARPLPLRSVTEPFTGETSNTTPPQSPHLTAVPRSLPPVLYF